jgi:hypothetical protein
MESCENISQKNICTEGRRSLLASCHAAMHDGSARHECTNLMYEGENKKTLRLRDRYRCFFLIPLSF